MSEVESGTIRYTVKELLGKVDVKLDAISAKLDAKADAHELDALTARVAILEKEAGEAAAVKTSQFTFTQKTLGAAFALITLVLNAMALGPDVVG